jgi:DNA-directed RNA polymerase I, II, and III subunit RPABC2
MEKESELDKVSVDGDSDDENENESGTDVNSDQDQDDDDDDDESDIEDEELNDDDNEWKEMKNEKEKETNITIENDSDSDSDNDEEVNEDTYLQKFQASAKSNIIADYHPEMVVHNEIEVELMSITVRNVDGIIIDKLHTTLPFITKYEKTRIIGERARQINSGAIPFIEIDPEIIDGYLIALEEFKHKKIPFIIKRPLPNGNCEYWKVTDLEII